MERLRKGYKQTELGIIPEDWEIISISTIGNTYTGLSGKKAIDFGSGEARYIPFLNILKNPYIDITSLESVSIGNDELQNKVRFGDLFFNTSSETPDEVGMCSVLLNNIPNLYLNSFCFGFRLFQPNRVNGLFLSYYFRNKQGRELMNQLAQGSTRYNLAKANFLQAKISLPSQKEQKAISEVLNDIDSLIEALDKKIAKKRAIKEGAMQQLLTGKKRLNGFNEPWIEKKLGAISQIKTGNRNGDENIEDGLYPFFVRSQIIHRINSYSFDGEAILVPGDGGIGDIFHYVNGKFDYHQRVYKISDFHKDYDCKFVFYYLKRYFGYYALQQTAKATVDSLRLPTFTDFLMMFPKSLSEQQAIAQILTDLDDEIQQLENERQKYTALKQGAMQQLLTGQIRLTNAEQSQQPSNIRTIPVHAHVIGGHIVNTLYGSRGWGRTKLQKSMHLIGYCCQLDFGNEYVRNVAGPDDQTLMNHLDAKFKQYRHVRIERTRNDRGGRQYNYIPTPMIAEAEQVFENYPTEIKSAINNLLNKLKVMDLARAEIVSTLYAVWNNRIIKGQLVDDNLLLTDFYDWSEHKADFSQDLVLRALGYMRREGIVPIGWGKYIDKK